MGPSAEPSVYKQDTDQAIAFLERQLGQHRAQAMIECQPGRSSLVTLRRTRCGRPVANSQRNATPE